MFEFIGNVKKHFYAIKVLVDINIKSTVLNTKLGWVWWILDPVIMMAIYYFLIKGIFGRGGENYHIFVLTGIIIWQAFTKSVNNSMNTIIGNKQIVKQIAFPLPLLVAIPILTNLFFALVGIIIIALVNYKFIGIHTLAILPILFLIGFLSYGIGLFVSGISVLIRDSQKIIFYILRAGFFLSPVLYPATRLLESDRISDNIKMLLQLNPMMWILTASRTVLVEGNLFNWREFFILAGIVFILVHLGLRWLKSYNNKIIKML